MATRVHYIFIQSVEFKSFQGNVRLKYGAKMDGVPLS